MTVEGLTKMNVEGLTKRIKKMKLGFNRKVYESRYFKRKAVCPRCGETKVRHMLKRHMKTKKCLSKAT